MSDFVTKTFELSFDNFVNAMKMVETDHFYIHQGLYFSYSEYVTITTGNSLTIGFKTPATLKDIHFRTTIIQTNVDSFRCLIQENPVLTGGSSVKTSCFNHNRKSSVVTAMQEFKTAMTISTPGTTILPIWMPGAVGQGQTRSGTGSPSQNEWVLKQNTWYCLQFLNGSAASQILNFTMNWYEEGELT